MVRDHGAHFAHRWVVAMIWRYGLQLGLALLLVPLRISLLICGP